MANINTPFGLKPVKHLNGSPWNSSVNLYYIPAADTQAYFIGDVVRSAAGGNLVNGASAVTLFGTRNAAATTGLIRGVVVGIGTAVQTPGGQSAQAFDPDNLASVSIPAVKTKDYYVWVVDSPTVIFETQVDTIAATAFNKNAPLFVANAPVGPLNQSGSFAQGSAAAVTATLPLRLFGAPAREDDELVAPGTLAKVFVLINQHELAGNTAGV
jgi:hypothetical protein